MVAKSRLFRGRKRLARAPQLTERCTAALLLKLADPLRLACSIGKASGCDAGAWLRRCGYLCILQGGVAAQTLTSLSWLMRGVALARRTLMAAQPAHRLATENRCAAAVEPRAAELRVQKDAARRAMRATLRAIDKNALEEDSAYTKRCMPCATLRLSCAVRAAGRLVVQRLLASSAFGSSSRVGVYVSCERLHEVDTRELLRVLLQPGTRCSRRCCVVRRLSCFTLHQGQGSVASPRLLGQARRRCSFIT